jgi:hypothetical protein
MESLQSNFYNIGGIFGILQKGGENQKGWFAKLSLVHQPFYEISGVIFYTWVETVVAGI